MSCFLGIDVGTSGVKVLLMDETGTICGSTYRDYDIIKPTLSSAEQDIAHIWARTAEALRELTSAHPRETAELRCIGFSGQMHGLVPLDAANNPVRNAIIWADQRSGTQISRIYDLLGKSAYEAVTKNALSTGFLLASLLWMREQEPECFEKTRSVVFPKDYIRYRICGEIGTEASDCSSGGIFDPVSGQWAWELIDRLGLERSLFPECRTPTEIAGTVTARCAEETGLPVGVPVSFGGGDTLMAAVGNGIVRPGILAANIGTACQLAAAVPTLVSDPLCRTNTFRHIPPEQWLLTGAHLSGGVALKWLKNQMLGMSSYDEMTALAATAPPGSDGMVCLPYLSGERTPYNDPDAKAIYYGMTLRHSRAHMIRSTMEGIIFGLKTSLELFRKLGIPTEQVIASGGGARGRLFLELQADIFDCEIRTNRSSEQAGMGAAVAAAVAVGCFGSFPEACEKTVQLSPEIISPNRENCRRYGESYAIFRELYDHNCDLFHKA